MFAEPTPTHAEPTGERYCFERGACKDEGATVGLTFGSGTNSPGSIRASTPTSTSRSGNTGNTPWHWSLPLLIVSNMVRFRIRTNWTDSVSRTHEFMLEDLAEPSARNILKWTMTDRERLQSELTR